MPTGTYYTPPFPGGLGEHASPIGPNEQFLSNYIQTSLMGGTPLSPQMKTLQNLLRGKPAIADEMIRAQKKFAKQQYRRDQAGITESFGKMGARFGTDLADTMSRGSQDFRQGLYAQEMQTRMQLAENAKNRALQAFNSILGFGKDSAQFEFLRGEGAAGRRGDLALQALQNEGALGVAELGAESLFDLELLKALIDSGLFS